MFSRVRSSLSEDAQWYPSRMLKPAVACVAVAVLWSCGRAAPALDPELLCSDQALQTDPSGVWVTQVGCSYEQHLENIMHHGEEVSLKGTPVRAAGSSVPALVQYKCGRYLMGKDQQGLA